MCFNALFHLVNNLIESAYPKSYGGPRSVRRWSARLLEARLGFLCLFAFDMENDEVNLISQPCICLNSVRSGLMKKILLITQILKYPAINLSDLKPFIFNFSIFKYLCFPENSLYHLWKQIINQFWIKYFRSAKTQTLLFPQTHLCRLQRYEVWALHGGQRQHQPCQIRG